VTPDRDWIDYATLLTNVGAGLGGIAAAGLAYWAVRLQYLARGTFEISRPREVAIRWRRDHMELRLALVFVNSGARPVVVDNLRVVMTGPSGPVELAYTADLDDLAQPDSELPFPRSAFMNTEDIKLGVERRAHAMLVGGYGGEQRICAFHAPPGGVTFVAGRHRFTLEMRRPGGRAAWTVVSVIYVELPRERLPQSGGWLAPVILPVVEGGR
jgi:hypothetical protein